MSNSMPTISVVCCTHNRKAFAQSHLESMLGHLDEDLELVYALDNCTDATRDSLEALAKGRPNVRVLEYRGERGLFNCRNFAIANVRGTHIHFLDDDDSVDPGFYKPLINYLQQSTGATVDLLLTQLKVCPENEQPYLRDIFSPTVESMMTDRNGLDAIAGDLFGWFIRGEIYYVPANAILKAELLRRFPYHGDFKKSADWLFILEAALKQSLTIVSCRAATANYMVHSDSMSTKPDKALWNLLVFERLLEMAKTRSDVMRTVTMNCALANFHAGYAIRRESPRRSRALYWRSFRLKPSLGPLVAILKTPFEQLRARG